MGNIYFDKMTTDCGAAPCVDKGKLSLAICKPSIRKKAKEADIVFGFGCQALGEKLIYVARIAKVIEDGRYYDGGSPYAGRIDCIYRWQDGELVFRRGAKVHGPEDRDHDVGPAAKHTRNANVLVADKFVYFGKAGTDEYKKTCPHLKRSIERLTQGHRINHRPELARELSALYRDCIAKHGAHKILGRPHHPLKNRPPCHESEGEAVCIRGTHSRSPA